MGGTQRRLLVASIITVLVMGLLFIFRQPLWDRVPLDVKHRLVAQYSRLTARRVETAAARTDFENDESRDRFWRLLERLGVDAELRRRGAGPGTTVHIGQAELEWGEDDG